jgi:hypothetical protein
MLGALPDTLGIRPFDANEVAACIRSLPKPPLLTSPAQTSKSKGRWQNAEKPKFYTQKLAGSPASSRGKSFFNKGLCVFLPASNPFGEGGCERRLDPSFRVAFRRRNR